MIYKVDLIRKEFETQLAEVKTVADAEKARVDFLGKKGKISLLMGELKNASPEEKKELGRVINELKQFAEKPCILSHS